MATEHKRTGTQHLNSKNIRVLPLAAVLAIVFASTSMADIMGSTYNFSTSTTGDTTITSTGKGSYTDPVNASFCVGPNFDNCSSSGLFGSYVFADITPTMSTITFNFFGSTDSTTGTFSIDLSNFVLPDGDTISNVAYASGNLIAGDFSNVSWNGAGAVFAGDAGLSDGFGAFGGAGVVFDVSGSAVSGPSSFFFLLIGTVLGGLLTGLKKRRLT